MRETILRGEFSAISGAEGDFQRKSGSPESRIFFRDLCLLLWRHQKADVALAQTAGISDRMARYLLKRDHPASPRVQQAVLDEVRRRIQE